MSQVVSVQAALPESAMPQIASSRLTAALKEFGIEVVIVAMVTFGMAANFVWWGLVLGIICLTIGWPLWAVSAWPVWMRIAVFLTWRYLLLGVLTTLRLALGDRFPKDFRPVTFAGEHPPPPAVPSRLSVLLWKVRTFRLESQFERSAANFFTLTSGACVIAALVWFVWLCGWFGWGAWVFPRWPRPLWVKVAVVVVWSSVWMGFMAAMRLRTGRKQPQ